MSCPDQESLSAFVDGELEAAALAVIERHLSDCASCRQCVKEFRALDERGRSSIRAIPVAKRSEPLTIAQPAPRRRQVRMLALAAAATVLVCVVAWLALQKPAKPRPTPVPVQAAGTRQPEHEGVPAGTTASDKDELAAATSDAAYERWAAPYRRLHIPLVPMEEVANYKPPAIVPVLPVPARPGNKI